MADAAAAAQLAAAAAEATRRLAAQCDAGGASIEAPWLVREIDRLKAPLFFCAFAPSRR